MITVHCKLLELLQVQHHHKLAENQDLVLVRTQLWQKLVKEHKLARMLDQCIQFRSTVLLRREFRLYCRQWLFRVLMAHPQIEDASQSRSVVNDSLLD